MENNSQVENLGKIKQEEYLKAESNKLLLKPFRALANFTAISGVFALIFEVRYFSDFSGEVYVARLGAIAIAYWLLIISNTNFGKKHPVVLVHLLLLSIIGSFGLIIFLIPESLVFNSHIISLIIFMAALFLSWEVSNQIVVAIYYNVVFAASFLLSDRTIYVLPNLFESVLLVLFISVMAVVASSINYKLRKEVLKKSYEVKVSEQKFKNIFENSAEGIFQVDFNGKILTANPAFFKMLGYSTEEEVKGLKLEKDLYKRPSDKDLLEKLLHKQGKVRNYRVSLKKKDKSELVVRLNARVYYDQKEEPLFYEGSMQDITQQVAAEVEKEKAHEALRLEKRKSDIAASKATQESNFKSKFLASMSHEVRTPMNSIMGFLTLIENDLIEDKKELKDFARDARFASESLLDIINNILDISKVEAGKMELDEEEIDLREEVNKAISIITQAARAKELKVSANIEESVPKDLIGDPTRFRQILVNLLNNAIKFTDEGEVKVDMSLKKEANTQVEILTKVIDTGAGIPSDKISFLFQPYAQVKSKKSNREGTGLGLVICKEFVNLMGGNIGVDSNIGKGSTFYFTAIFKRKETVVSEDKDKIVIDDIEVSEAEDKSTAEEPLVEELIEDSSGGQSKRKILLVEDNPISQNLELKILREVGYAVEAVSSGYDAVKAIQTNSFDLVLMDVEMTDLDGISATKKIRDLTGPVANIPIIAVTAHSSMKDREKCLAAGMDDYIAKPINIHFLKITIDQWLEGRV